MTLLTYASLAFALLSAAAGFCAAYWWWKASAEEIDPSWTVEPGEPEAAQAGWVAATMKSIVISARLNKKAAKWTAVAVFLGAMSAVVGAIASLH